jgi:hypothetical protein
MGFEYAGATHSDTYQIGFVTVRIATLHIPQAGACLFWGISISGLRPIREGIINNTSSAML